MTDERFNELVNGPLRHASVVFTISRLALALKACVDASPEAEKALEEYCAFRDRSADVESNAVDPEQPDDLLWGTSTWKQEGNPMLATDPRAGLDLRRFQTRPRTNSIFNPEILLEYQESPAVKAGAGRKSGTGARLAQAIGVNERAMWRLRLNEPQTVDAWLLGYKRATRARRKTA